MARLDFDANDHEPQTNYEPIPAGDYVVIIEESDMKETAKKKRSLLET